MTPSPPYDSTNGRVTMAVLAERLDTAIRKIDSLDAKVDSRMAFLEEKFEIGMAEVRGHCGENEKQIARLEERQKSTTGILGAFTLVASSVAGVLASVFN